MMLHTLVCWAGPICCTPISILLSRVERSFMYIHWQLLTYSFTLACQNSAIVILSVAFAYRVGWLSLTSQMLVTFVTV